MQHDTSHLDPDSDRDPQYPPRKRFRNSKDPLYQGDGWRWTLSFWLPGLRLFGRHTSPTGYVVRLVDGGFPGPCPFTLDQLPLTRAQRAAVYGEVAAFAAHSAELRRARQPHDCRNADVVLTDQDWPTLGFYTGGSVCGPWTGPGGLFEYLAATGYAPGHIPEGAAGVLDNHLAILNLTMARVDPTNPGSCTACGQPYGGLTVLAPWVIPAGVRQPQRILDHPDHSQRRWAGATVLICPCGHAVTT